MIKDYADSGVVAAVGAYFTNLYGQGAKVEDFNTEIENAFPEGYEAECTDANVTGGLVDANVTCNVAGQQYNITIDDSVATVSDGHAIPAAPLES